MDAAGWASQEGGARGSSDQARQVSVRCKGAEGLKILGGPGWGERLGWAGGEQLD